MKRKKKYISLFVFFICILALAAAFCVLRFRGGVIVRADEDVIPDKDVVFYRQDDERWAKETLGDSAYTMGKGTFCGRSFGAQANMRQMFLRK